VAFQVRCNAWTGREVAAGTIEQAARWALRRRIEAAPRLLAPRTKDPRDWRDPSIGWGVVLADKAAIPGPLNELISERKAPVFRYIKDWDYEFALLRNYAAGKDIDINAAPRGMASDALPAYLLIYGTPDQVPWRLQYVLNANRSVGRLPLFGKQLENYVSALRTGHWFRSAGAAAQSSRAVLWSVDLGGDDITTLMRNSIAAPLFKELSDDPQIGQGARFLDGQQRPAMGGELASALATDRPGLIVTTSHGMTGPLDDRAAMARNLGLPVDSTGTAVTSEAVLSTWQPGGAVWYAHACCSAGCDSASSFSDLVSSSSVAGKVLAGVAALGARVAPLPLELLGAEEPLRAFIGHVEPTFDWTLRQPATGQFLTAGIVGALYDDLYVHKGDLERPVGFAFREWYARTNGLRAEYVQSVQKFNDGEDTEGILLALQLAARDVESTVILGDPTVALPGLG
jgi:hypothetical protein